MAAGWRSNFSAAEKTETPQREDYKHWLPIATRWMDNDVYGHVNNVVYYSYFDTVVNRYLIDEGGLDIQNSDGHRPRGRIALPLLQPLAFPRPSRPGLRVAQLGTRACATRSRSSAG